MGTARANQAIIEELLAASDRVSTAGDWITPLGQAVEGVGAAEAAWKPGPDERSIWEIVHHVIAWARWAVGWLGGEDTEVTDWPPVVRTDEDAWRRTQEELHAVLAALRERIAGLGPDDLFAVPTPEVTSTNRFRGIQSILVHNAYHAGQITKLRERGWKEQP